MNTETTLFVIIKRFCRTYQEVFQSSRSIFTKGKTCDFLLTLVVNNHVSSIYFCSGCSPPPPIQMKPNARKTYPRFHNILIPSLIFQVTDTAENIYYSSHYRSNNKVQIDQIIVEFFSPSSSLYLLLYIDQGVENHVIRRFTISKLILNVAISIKTGSTLKYHHALTFNLISIYLFLALDMHYKALVFKFSF